MFGCIWAAQMIWSFYGFVLLWYDLGEDKDKFSNQETITPIFVEIIRQVSTHPGDIFVFSITVVITFIVFALQSSHLASLKTDTFFYPFIAVSMINLIIVVISYFTTCINYSAQNSVKELTEVQKIYGMGVIKRSCKVKKYLEVLEGFVIFGSIFAFTLQCQWSFCNIIVTFFNIFFVAVSYEYTVLNIAVSFCLKSGKEVRCITVNDIVYCRYTGIFLLSILCCVLLAAILPIWVCFLLQACVIGYVLSLNQVGFYPFLDYVLFLCEKPKMLFPFLIE